MVIEIILLALLIKETLHLSEIQRIMSGENIVTEEELLNYKKRIEVAKNWSKDASDASSEKNAQAPVVEKNKEDDSPTPLDPLTQLS